MNCSRSGIHNIINSSNNSRFSFSGSSLCLILLFACFLLIGRLFPPSIEFPGIFLPAFFFFLIDLISRSCWWCVILYTTYSSTLNAQLVMLSSSRYPAIIPGKSYVILLIVARSSRRARRASLHFTSAWNFLLNLPLHSRSLCLMRFVQHFTVSSFNS